MPKPLIFDFDYDSLAAGVHGWGEPDYRADQIWQGLYQNLWGAPDEFSNLPLSLRSKLEKNFSFSHLAAAKTLHSTDGQTQKTLFALPDGTAVETVLMRYDERRTLCISTQIGCAMGCTFCATGQMGFTRNLTSGEIVQQVIHFERILRESDEHVTNVVVMGMGEPFHNYEETLKAIDTLNANDGFNMGARRFTISTVGLIPAIQRFAKEQRQVKLAVSLHAADDELRATMLPVNDRYPIKDLIGACRDYVEQTNRRITFEWALIQDVNDTQEQAKKLAALLKGLLCHVNLIPLNPTTGYAGEGSTEKRANAFRSTLEQSGIPCTIRVRRGIDIAAGCGQLAVDS